MSASDTKLLEKLRQLPPEKLVEVEDFVDFPDGVGPAQRIDSRK